MKNIFFAILLLLVFTACDKKESTPMSDNYVVNFIKNHPDKSSIRLIHNDAIITEVNGDRMMPLASTVKIIIAIEYAIQAANGQIDADEPVSIEDLDVYYVANTDGGAHPAWLESVRDQIVDNKIPLRQVAKGMIAYSSNANTEWLGTKLGLDNVNNRLVALGITDHDEIYHLVSSLFVGKELFPDQSGDELRDNLRDLTLEQYIAVINVIHNKLLTDPNYKNDLGDLSLKIQKVWSDNLAGSTANEYANLMKKLNSKTHFEPKVYQYLNETMETIMENPDNATWLEHAGLKGGSTAFVLTTALYATDRQGATTELAFMFDNLTSNENQILQNHLNDFELKILTEPEFRDEIMAVLGI